MRQWVLLLLVILPGSVGFLVFGAYAIIDYVALQQAYILFEHAVHSSGPTAIMVAEAQQNMHRINLFAEGVWALLCALIVAVGLHGLCGHPAKR